MSKKFTGITSAGSAIPVYDKDAHSALEQKLDASAFSSVSGSFLTSGDLDGYATEGFVESAVSGKADTSAIPSLDGYATQEWVGEQGYLTEVPESAVSGFATHEEVDSATSGKMDVSGLASGWAPLTASPYSLQAYSAYNGIPFYAASVSGFNSKLDGSAATDVSPNFSRNNDQNNGYAKFSGWNKDAGIDISGAYTRKRIYITDAGITLSGYSSQEDADQNINAHYLNITPENYVDKTKFKNIVANDNEIYVPNDVKTVSGNYDTQYYNYSFIGDFSGNDNLGKEFTVTLPVATTSVTYTAAEQDWNWLYVGKLTADTPKTEWKITPNKDYTAKKQDYEIEAATFYTFQITQSPFPYTGGVVSASLVTWNDDIFATRPWVEEQLSANVPQGVMQTSGLEYDGDKISGYMGSAFKAGDELPSGVMNTSALEYNAVNEISGYNGSAIAQYGAEKQWLQHDDTLVHAANSAQYALGVNLSAVAQLLGVDETVLFFAGNDSSGYQSGNLTESIKNFKTIKVVGMDNDAHIDVKYIYPQWTHNADNGTANVANYEVMFYGANPYQNTVWEKWVKYSFSALTAFTVSLGYEGSYTANTISNVTNNHKFSVREVIGIGRKEV